MTRSPKSLIVLLACFWMGWHAPLPATAQTPQFAADTAALTRHANRLTGSDGAQESAAYVAERLRGLGMDIVIEHPFASVGLEVLRCELAMETPEGGGSRVLPLQPMRPNGIMAPVSPVAGIRGALVQFDARTGGFSGGSPEGAIVVLDYNTEAEWLRAFRMGARAVIFARAPRHTARFLHAVGADANLPRFYYDGPLADLPAGQEVVIHSEIRWRKVTARNVYGVLKGTGPVFDFERDELLVLTSRLDSYGEVPALSAGARGAANCAALLLMAESLLENPPRRNVLFAFLDAEVRGYAGSGAMYRAFEDASHRASAATQLESLANEGAILDQLQSSLEADVPLASGGANIRRDLRDRLRAKAETRSFDVKYSLFGLRQGRQAANDPRAPDPAAAAELRMAIAERESLQNAWNDVRRYLVAPDGPAEEGLISELLDQILDEVREDVDIRMTEIAQEVVSAEAAQALWDAVGDNWLALHVSLLFGDARPQWGFITGGDSDWRSGFDHEGLYGRIQSTLLASANRALQDGHDLAGFETRSVDGMLASPRLFWGAPWLIHGGDIAGSMGVYNGVFGTIQDPLEREGTPCDTHENLNLAVVASQAREAAILVAHAGSELGLSLRRSIRQARDYVLAGCTPTGNLTGPRVMARSAGSSIPNLRMPDTVIRIANRGRAEGTAHTRSVFPGFDNFNVLLSNRNGSYSYGPVALDPNNNLVQGFGAVFDGQGHVLMASTQDSLHRVSQRLTLFPGRAGAAVVAPQFTSGQTSILRAAGNSPVAPDRHFGRTLDGVVYWFVENRIDALKLFGLQTIVRLHSGSDSLTPGGDREISSQPEGEGFEVEDTRFIRSAARSAADLWRLNESRLAVLRARGINNASLEELHGRAQDLALDAEELETPVQQESLHASSFLMQRRVYDMVRATLHDLVHAVLILLLLAVPFAFALERLLIGATTIYKRLLGFAAFFIATFAILYFTHPAFAISATPIIIFLGFAIVMLSSLVIVVIMGKFEHELKVLQGAASTVHAADVSRMSTVLAAMNMGISTMRRRPLRTALTAVTITLLTFTILCFASFGTRIGIVRLFLDAGPPYSGVFVRDVRWGPLGISVRQMIESRWGTEADVVARYWLSPDGRSVQGVLTASADGVHVAAMQGVLGIDRDELRQRADLAELLPGAADSLAGRIWMTSAAANMIGAEPGDTVIAGGQILELAAHLDASAMLTAVDMDGSHLLPVDFRDIGGTARPLDTVESLLDQPDWSYLPADSVIVVGVDAAQAMGAQLRAITLYTPDREAAVAIAEDITRIAGRPVAVTTPQGTFRYLLGNVVQASGFQDLFFPILLGGLVVFGTMLGSVADREREIYTFSALGLAPPHVASLFFAEAMVFSVIGGMGGYLLAQGSMKLLELLASFGLLTVPELNYSSMNAIVTILIVMATVLVSALYPALRASRSANPGLLRTWRLPAPQGDTLDLVFPFTVSVYDITGVVSFLREHFDNYTDSGMGTFMARDTRLIHGGEGRATVRLQAEIALAPFDLGVTQHFQLDSIPSEIPGIDEVRIRLDRLSGQPKDWHRLNKVLLDDLRKQFLIWRALPQETMESYRQRTLQVAGDKTSGGV